MESTNPSDQQSYEDQTDDEERIVKSKTFYYSNFDLFDETSHFFFLKYQIFKKSLSGFLGEDWNTYANMTIYFEKQYAKVYIDKKTIFNTALEVWLDIRKTVAPDRNFEDFKLFESFLSKFIEKFQSYKISNFVDFIELFLCVDNSTFKPVMQGFYVSAVKVWNDLIAGKDIWKVKIEENEEEKGDGKEGENIQETQTQQLLNKQTQRPISQSRIIKPLLVAKEKIFNYFAPAKKSNLGPIPEAGKQLSERSSSFHEDFDDCELKNYKNFNSTMKIEAGNEIANSIKNLSEQEMKNLLTPDPYAFNIKNINQKRKNNGPPCSPQENIFIEVTKLTRKEEKVFNKTFINNVSDFAKQIGNSKESRWQVARNLVTTMIEVNYNYFLSNIAQPLIINPAKDLRIRFLQPAQEFYNQLMDTWLISKSNSLNSEVRFKDFLEKVKKTFGGSWNENLAGPTQFFFNTLYTEWNKIKQEDNMEDTHEDRVRLFVRRVRENMLGMWEENIIKKAEELDNKVIQQHTGGS